MSSHTTYVGDLGDGQGQLLVERWLDDDGVEVEVTAATRENRFRAWGPPITLKVAP